MNKIKLTALPCICADVFYGTDIIRPGGEALNFAAHASHFKNVDVILLGIVGKDKYAEVIMDSIETLAFDKDHIRIDERYPTANNMTYLTESGDRYYKDDSWNGQILDNIVLNDNEIKILSESDVVFVHFLASCFSQIIELKKTSGFKLAVDFDVYRDFADMELEQKLTELKAELFNLRFQLATNQLDNPKRVTEVKRTIAKIKTVLRERELKQSV